MTTALTRSSRARSWLTVTAVFILAVSLGWGLIIFIWSLAVHTGPRNPATPKPATATATRTGIVSAGPITPASATSASRPVTAEEDELAARPMRTVPLSAAQPQPIAAAETAAAAIALPLPADPAAALPSGFPHTPEGAIAQLAAIDAAAFRELNPATVAEVHARAALPGAVPMAEWTPNVGVTAILRAIGQRDGSSTVTATWTLTHAQVKGVLAGGDFVLACVLGELDATYHSTARAGVGDCQRMIWQNGRWHLGPGAQPAFAPSTWPGSADCIRAGWLEARRA